MSIAMEWWVFATWADFILHFTQVALETYTAQLVFSEERDDDNLVRLSGFSYMLHCVLIFPFSPQIDHLENSLSSEVEFSKNVDPAATQPERKTSEMFLRVVTLCTKKNHKKRPSIEFVSTSPLSTISWTDYHILQVESLSIFDFQY